MIRFAVKLAVLLAVLLLFVPLPAEEPAGSDPAGLGEAADLTFTAVRDIGSFCGRNPQACEAGQDLIASLGARALAASRLAFEFLDARFGEEPAAGPAGTGEPGIAAAAGEDGALRKPGERSGIPAGS